MRISVALMLAMTLTSVQAESKENDNMQDWQHNPFSQPASLPFQAPPFDRIKESDYRQALEKGMAEKRREVMAIAQQQDAPTFANTYEALERSGQLLNRVNLIFSAMTAANTSDYLQQLDEEMQPRLAALQDEIYLNATLFSRLDAVYQQRDKLHLDAESLRLVEETWQAFRLAGATLNEEQKTRLKKLNQQEASLSTRFTNRLLAASKAGSVQINLRQALEGLSDSEIASAHQAASAGGGNGWLLALQNTTQQPALQRLTDRHTREALFTAGWQRAEKGDGNDTREILLQLADVRARQAELLGYQSYAQWALTNQMAKTPGVALRFMRDLVPAATARAKREAADLQAVIDQQKGHFTLAPWDWQYYAAQVKQSRYHLDESEIRPYFELNNVLENGVFYAASQLYGLHFKARHDIPVYHPDVRVYEVRDRDGSPLGLFYADLFKRDNKGGGAWMSNFVNQSTLLDSKPVIYNVANIPHPPAGEPVLLSWDEVITLFHEFGHALHGLFATQRYPSLSGTNTPRDFVEFPSQLNEHWASDPQVFRHYARHWQTGAVMPQALHDKVIRASRFNKGYEMTELLAAALLDMHWHSIDAQHLPQNVDTFENQALSQEAIALSAVPPRYRSSYFQHIWGGGYAAGYYAYLWTQMLADDGFSWFNQRGGLTAENGQIFRDKVLSRGNSEDLQKLYHDWRGHDPQIGPMLINRGLKEAP
ncbi:dipeptidyl carboxypeptidase II [Erwinia sp. OLTSP20]|uniref:peptidyl-dipeptidase Dcp n=1 Tax=unclassified Erwinia TaxID=2622719 RepID=UPI000C193B05|nr:MULTISPECIES: peptidyl-dipeptidase Dcp [unclassified Erwinia]PIJ51703.1 dipeptidyl carboxypeptidase II [Erwinia sp. OAMSP11]PIJ75590.1 dipeptidyl carboxypeptidase II [Erwinia sp. OLSSP12]PIJ84895.1 dipeptidyl carboxypeptidase II [Erwinia sp. OLCASP19]PIJ86674.1 dipeptidyl carboxypeptidase II [Erwinia sp. OLMTSP26]PIJ88115.1 dipeptidyl carboxypeptidase II [Erwinia sp. OLMDSP33]